MNRRVRLGRRLRFVYGAVGLLFCAGIVSTAWNLDLIETHSRAVIEEDARLLRHLEDLRQGMKEALESARLAGADPNERARALPRRRAAARYLEAVRGMAVPGEEADFAELDRAWGEAEAGFEALAGQERAADRIFNERILPPLAEAGAAISRIEDSRRASSFHRVREIEEQVRRARIQLTLFVLFMAVVGIGSIAMIRRRILAPILRLEEATERISGGDLAPRVGEYSDDEIGDFTRHFDAMTERLARAEKSRMEFLSMVSHEMRTPLTTIGGYLSILAQGKRGILNERQTQALGIVKSEAQRLSDLVEDLLDAARAEAGAFRVDPAPCEPAPALEEILAPFANTAEERKISLEVDIAGLPPAVLDVRRVGQAVRNLLGNALKFTPEGGHVRVHGRREGEFLVIDVSDTGPGIPPEKVPRIFEKFYQMAPIEKGAEGKAGVGLGLAVVREIARAHGGEALVESEVGRGTRFSIRIPHRAAEGEVEWKEIS